MEKTNISKWGMRLLALVIWLTFSYITCISIINLWISYPDWSPLILSPLSSIVAWSAESGRAWIMREIKGLYEVARAEEPEHDKPWEPQAWPVGGVKP